MNALAQNAHDNLAPVAVTETASWYGIGGNACRLTARCWASLGFDRDPAAALTALHEVLSATSDAIARPAFEESPWAVAFELPATGTALVARLVVEDVSLLIDLAVADDASPAGRLACSTLNSVSNQSAA